MTQVLSRMLQSALFFRLSGSPSFLPSSQIQHFIPLQLYTANHLQNESNVFCPNDSFQRANNPLGYPTANNSFLTDC